MALDVQAHCERWLDVIDPRSVAEIHLAGHDTMGPIVIDHQGRLIDGRNRLAACRLAVVAPTYYTPPTGTLADDDAIAARLSKSLFAGFPERTGEVRERR